MLRILQDLVALTLATFGIGGGILVAVGRIKTLQSPIVRILTSPVLIVFGLYIFYAGIRHMVAD